ncbi:YheC/YheD family protein [Sporosarcina highlanderae]|uniref:YheC/YheD family protein n=1 Tax=Sporosarcina highlanderae TaxID=3035916 RepID=A0ABT8JWD4_9BACL|nr:YheC/YheD family protein [Sporosarcina highlanderae]MDN4608474.1 YheC/YheD family protein [Sporosarcina highlanderae]
MKKAMGKWEQSLLLRQDSLVAKHIPETVLYSENSLDDLLNRYQAVYVKHDTTGQGRAILKIHKNDGGKFYVNGFTIQGTPVQKYVSGMNEIQQLLHPFLKLNRLSGLYIIQEKIQSITEDGLPFVIRVHTQKLNSNWLIGGMYAAISTGTETESGIVNSHRGAQVIPISDVLAQTRFSDNQENIVKKIEEIAIAAAKVIHSALPCRDYGMDFGVDQNGTPILFEVNTTPSIRSFAKIENKEIWRRIMEIRKLQSE